MQSTEKKGNKNSNRPRRVYGGLKNKYNEQKDDEQEKKNDRTRCALFEGWYSVMSCGRKER